jgi:hypothetical protein
MTNTVLNNKKLYLSIGYSCNMKWKINHVLDKSIRPRRRNDFGTRTFSKTMRDDKSMMNRLSGDISGLKLRFFFQKSLVLSVVSVSAFTNFLSFLTSSQTATTLVKSASSLLIVFANFYDQSITQCQPLECMKCQNK